MKFLLLLFVIVQISACMATKNQAAWILVDDFEGAKLSNWHLVDAQNDTKPHIANPQVSEIRKEKNNQYLLKKPAAKDVIGNRKALTFKALPVPVELGETYTFYTRILVESFPNNHAFGLSNLMPEQIVKEAYNAFEPTLRVTDKYESNGFKNDGTLMVKIDSDDKYKQYSNIQNYKAGRSASPLQIGVWYQLWYVVNNSPVDQGGQTYDVYISGGEFDEQTLVYKNAAFRMKREKALIYFFANSNTGPHDKPYGNGGLAYDDIYMGKGLVLTAPIKQ